jgi:trimeric autotransporter adhesin
VPFLGTRGAGTNKAFGFAGAAKPNQVTGLTATDFGTSRAYNNGRIDLSWTTPANNGATISGYKIERSTDNVTYSTLVASTGTTATTYSDTSLNSSQIYYYKVSAINAAGTSDASTAASATATTVPQAPTVTAVNIGTGRAYNNGAATITATGGATGGKTISSYTATSSPGSFTASSGSPVTVTGLQSATAYTFSVTATNANGTSTATTSGSITATTVPQAPTIGTATCATGQAYTGSANISVPFTAGATGGSAISSYTVTSSSTATASGASSPLTISQAVGSSYTYTVTATNANGTSSASSASNSVLSASVPSTPTIGTATAGVNSASITFSAPASNGGSAITGYTMTSSGGQTGTGAGSPITVSGLSDSATYTFTVKATNAFGTSAASGASNSVTIPIPKGGYSMGGQSNPGGVSLSSIDRMTFANETYGGISSSLPQTRYNGGGVFNNGVAGYVAGGTTAGNYTSSSIFKLNYTTQATSTIAATLTFAVSESPSVSNSGTAAYWYLYNTATTYSKMVFSSETVSSLNRGAGAASDGRAGMQNIGTAGYWSGGQSVTVINKAAFSSDTWSSLAAAWSGTNYGGNGYSNTGTAGYFGGGGISGAVKIAFSNDSTSGISVYQNGWQKAPAYANGNTAAYLPMGFYNAFNNLNTIYKQTFPTDVVTTLSATITTLRHSVASVANY